MRRRIVPLSCARVLQEAFLSSEAITALHLRRSSRALSHGGDIPPGEWCGDGTSEIEALEDRLWDGSATGAMLRVSVNPDGTRRRACASKPFTLFNGLRHEEILSRLANRQVHLPANELEQVTS